MILKDRYQFLQSYRMEPIIAKIAICVSWILLILIFNLFRKPEKPREDKAKQNVYIVPIIFSQALRRMTPRRIDKIDKTPNSTNKSDKW